MGYSVTFVFIYTMCNDWVRVISISSISNSSHFFLLGTLKIVSSGHFEIYNKLLTIVILSCYTTLQLIPPNCIFVHHPPRPLYSFSLLLLLASANHYSFYSLL